MHWFFTSWTFKTISLMNLNESQCQHHLDLSMIEGIHGFVMFSLSLSKIGWILFSNAIKTLQQKNTGQKMFISWQTYERLKISVNSIFEATQFLLWNQVKYVLLERFCQDPPENWFGRQRSLGLRKDNLSMADFRYNNNAIRN